MKKALLVLVILGSGVMMTGGDYVRKSDFFQNEYSVYSNFGVKRGSLRKDIVDPHRWNFYDQLGIKGGYFREDDFEKGKWIFRK